MLGELSGSHRSLNHHMAAHPQTVNGMEHVHHLLMLQLLQEPVKGNESA